MLFFRFYVTYFLFCFVYYVAAVSLRLSILHLIHFIFVLAIGQEILFLVVNTYLPSAVRRRVILRSEINNENWCSSLSHYERRMLFLFVECYNNKNILHFSVETDRNRLYAPLKVIKSTFIFCLFVALLILCLFNDGGLHFCENCLWM